MVDGVGLSPAGSACVSSVARGGGGRALTSEVATRLLRPTAAANAITTAASTTAEGRPIVVANSEGISRATAPATMMASANRRRASPAPTIRLVERVRRGWPAASVARTGYCVVRPVRRSLGGDAASPPGIFEGLHGQAKNSHQQARGHRMADLDADGRGHRWRPSATADSPGCVPTQPSPRIPNQDRGWHRGG